MQILSFVVFMVMAVLFVLAVGYGLSLLEDETTKQMPDAS